MRETATGGCSAPRPDGDTRRQEWKRGPRKEAPAFPSPIPVPAGIAAEAYPEVAKQWHPTKNGSLLPKEVYAGSNRKAWWMCERGHEWEAVIGSRQRTGCPHCSNRRVIPGENDLATTNLELVSEWHPTKNGVLKPTDVVSGSNQKVWWMCEKGHEWETVINHRAQGKGCPYCKNRRLLRGFNDLQTVSPKIAAEWHPTKNGDLKLSDVFSTVLKKVWWKCEKGHEWEAPIGSRTTGGTGCPYCSGHRAIPGETDLGRGPSAVRQTAPNCFKAQQRAKGMAVGRVPEPAVSDGKRVEGERPSEGNPLGAGLRGHRVQREESLRRHADSIPCNVTKRLPSGSAF